MAKREEEQGGNKNKGDQDEELEEEEEDGTEGEGDENSDSDAVEEGDDDAGTEDQDSDDDAEEEVEDDDEDDEEEAVLKIKPADLQKMIEKRVKKALQKQKDRKSARSARSWPKLTRARATTASSTKTRRSPTPKPSSASKSLKAKLTIQGARNQAFSYALAKHPDVADGIDEWVVPKIEKQIRELDDPDETQIAGIVKREVQTYAQQFDRTQKKKRQNGEGIPSGSTRTQMRQPVNSNTNEPQIASAR
jgi:hypothetical protein